MQTPHVAGAFHLRRVAFQTMADAVSQDAHLCIVLFMASTDVPVPISIPHDYKADNLVCCSYLTHRLDLRRPWSDDRYYVGVFNNDLYLQEPAEVQVTARWADKSAQPLCPWNCTYHGQCLPNSACRCNPGAVERARCLRRLIKPLHLDLCCHNLRQPAEVCS